MKTCSLVKYSAGVVALFCIILLALHTANVIVFTSSDQLHNGSFVNSANVTIPPKREDDLVTQKNILLWNGDWSDLSAFGTGHDAFMKAKCAVSVGRNYQIYDVVLDLLFTFCLRPNRTARSSPILPNFGKTSSIPTSSYWRRLIR